MKRLEDILRIARENDDLVSRVIVARNQYWELQADLRANTERLRADMIELAHSIAVDGADAALRAVLAIHRGDDDAAYAFARAAARCARSTQEADEVLYGLAPADDAVGQCDESPHLATRV
jgi:hypothetical protein